MAFLSVQNNRQSILVFFLMKSNDIVLISDLRRVCTVINVLITNEKIKKLVQKGIKVLKPDSVLKVIGTRPLFSLG